MLFSRDALEEASPSREHGIDARLEASYRWSYCEFLKDSGIELKMCDFFTFRSRSDAVCARTTQAHDTSNLLPPFLRLSFSRGPGERQIRACGVIPIFTLFTSTLHNLRQPYLARLLTKLLLAMQVVATACLFLAGKVEETPKPLNEVVRVCYLVQHKHEYESALKQIHQKVRPTSCLLTCLHNTRAAQK
jgi:hypothetical protein